MTINNEIWIIVLTVMSTKITLINFEKDQTVKDSLKADEALQNLQSERFLVWETCLRKVVIAQVKEHANLGRGDQPGMSVFENEKALEFLLELISGLHSKILGETEILGQFKIFVESHPEISQLLEPQHIQFLLREVKDLRSKYVKNFGQKSYGSLLRKFLQSDLKLPQGEVIDIIGAGQLTEKMTPYLENYRMQIYLRNENSATRFINAKMSELSPIFLSQNGSQNVSQKKASVLVIAAPISNADLKSHFDLASARAIFDLRSETEKDGSLKGMVLSHTHVSELDDFFRQLQNDQEKALKMIPEIKQEIHRRVSLYWNRSIHRPSGWDDLC